MDAFKSFHDNQLALTAMVRAPISVFWLGQKSPGTNSLRGVAGEFRVGEADGAAWRFSTVGALAH